MDQKELDEILEKHEKWLAGEPDGERAIINDCDLYGLDLSGRNMRYCDLSYCDLRSCDLSGSDLRKCKIIGSEMSNSNLRFCNMSNSDLSDSDMIGCNMRECNLSGCTGLVSPIQYMEKNFERSADGYIAYKVFNAQYLAPGRWILQPGAVIEETVNANRTDDCGCGINVAPLNWVYENYSSEVWKVLIRWEWLPGVCVPYNTDGNIRCERVELIEIVQ